MGKSYPSHVVSLTTGKRYAVHVSYSRIPSSNLDSGYKEYRRGLPHMRLSDGRSLMSQDDGTFTTVDGEPFNADTPTAGL